MNDPACQEDLHGRSPRQASFVRVHSGLDTDDGGFGDTVKGLHQLVDGQRGHRALPPQVRIDERSAFKYVLLEMVGVEQQDLRSKELREHASLLVRGSTRFNFHKQNVVEAQKELEAIGLPACVQLFALLPFLN